MRARFTLAAFGLSLLVVASAASAPSWGGSVQISVGDRALGPELALNGSGDGLVVWDQEIGAVCAQSPASLSCIHVVQAVVRSATSGGWAAPVDISRPGIGSAPQVAIDEDGDAAILWVHDIGRDRVVQATYRNGSSGSFPEPNDLSDSVLQVRDHHIAVDGWGDAMAVWAERSADIFVVRGAIRNAQSGVWGSPVLLSTPGANVSAGPSLALERRGLGAIAWVEDGVVRTRPIYTARWQPITTVSNAASTVDGAPSVAVGAEGDTILAWPARKGSDNLVEAAFMAYRPGTWFAPVDVGVRSPTFGTPQATVDPYGNADVAWVGARGVESAFRSYGSDVWSRPVRISARSVTPSEVSLSIFGPGNAVALWHTTDGRLQAALRPRASGAWQEPIELSSGGSTTPSVALAADGRAVAVWNHISGDRAFVETAELDGKGPVLDRLTAPRKAVAVGAPALFSIRAVPWGAPLSGVSSWTFGDGGAARGTEVSHAYRRVGRHTVTFSQPDARGDVSTATAIIEVVARVRNVRPPSILGVPAVAATLTCRRGVWSGSPPITFAYRWRRDGKPIAGATSRRYRLLRRDAGSLISCEVEATNPAGSARARSRAVGVKG